MFALLSSSVKFSAKTKGKKGKKKIAAPEGEGRKVLLLISPSKKGKLQLMPKKNSCDSYAQHTQTQALP